ncbi:hypothetical protein R6Q59_023576 [Mikania micrantha]
MENRVLQGVSVGFVRGRRTIDVIEQIKPLGMKLEKSDPRRVRKLYAIKNTDFMLDVGNGVDGMEIMERLRLWIGLVWHGRSWQSIRRTGRESNRRLYRIW